MGKLLTLPIDQVRENPVALRQLQKDCEEYKGLVDSIRNLGFTGAITVRARQDSETGQDYYELIDGLHRLNAAKDAGVTEINVTVENLNDSEVLEAQLMANVHKIETKPAEYSKQLRTILARNPLMTEAELGNKIGKSAAWIGQRLGLNKITDVNISQLVDSGKIVLTNAFALAKLPSDEQKDWVDRAMTLSPDEFIPQCNARVKEIREAKRKGKDARPQEFQPVAHSRRIKELKDELDTGTVGSSATGGLNTPEEGFRRGIEWVLHLDPKSVEEQKAEHERRKKEREETKLRKEKEKAERKQKEANEALESLI